MHAAEKQALDAKGVEAPLVFNELQLIGAYDILAVGHYGHSYTSFYVGEDLTPSLNVID